MLKILIANINCAWTVLIMFNVSTTLQLGLQKLYILSGADIRDTDSFIHLKNVRNIHDFLYQFYDLDLVEEN